MKQTQMPFPIGWFSFAPASTPRIIGRLQTSSKFAYVLVAALIYLLSGWAIPAQAQIDPTILSQISTMTFNHQNGLNTQAEINFINQQRRAGVEPWASNYSKMANSPAASLTYTPSTWATGTLLVNGGQAWEGANDSPDYGGNALIVDSQAAYTQALMWEFTGTATYAQNAVKIMNAWSANLKSIGGDNWYLVAGWSGSCFPLAAEILRNNSAFTSADQAQFTSMLNNVYLPELNERYSYGNREFACCNALCAIGVYNNDRAAFYQGIRHWMSYLPCYVYMTADGTTPIVANYWVTTGTNPEPTPSQYCQMDLALFPNPTSSNCWILASNMYPTADISPPKGTSYYSGEPASGDDKTTMLNVYNNPSQYLASSWWVGSNPNTPSNWQSLAYFQGQSTETVSRDLGHVENSIGEIFAVAEMARIQGFDIYTTPKLRLQALLEMNSYLRLNNPPPDGLSETNIDQTNLTPTYEAGYNHLVNVLGLSLPYTQQLINPVIRSAQNEYITYGVSDFWKQIITAPTGITAGTLGIQETYSGGWETLMNGDLNGDYPGLDPNIALGQTAVASSTSGTYSASFAVDGNLGTRWASTENNSSPVTLYVNLGGQYNITGVTLNWDGSGTTGGYATGYSIQTSNSPSGPWTTIYTTTTSTGGYQQLTGLSGVGQYVQLLASTPYNQYDYSLWDFQVFGTTAVPTTGLVAYYQFDNNANDSSGLGNNGTADLGFTYSSTYAAAGAAYSGQLNGTGAQVDVPNSTSLQITGNLTVASWIYPTAISGNQDIIAKSDNSGYRFRLTTSGQLSLILGNTSGGENQVYSTQTVSAGQWTHVAATVTFSGSTATVQFYVNGVPDTSGHTTSLSSINPGTGSLIIGCAQNYDNEPFGGYLDQVLIYNLALTSQQIANLATP
jgi:hypothetical protein